MVPRDRFLTRPLLPRVPRALPARPRVPRVRYDLLYKSTEALPPHAHLLTMMHEVAHAHLPSPSTFFHPPRAWRPPHPTALGATFMPSSPHRPWRHVPCPPHPTALGATWQVALGMHYLHTAWEAPVLHLDLKSANVLIDYKGIAKVSGLPSYYPLVDSLPIPPWWTPLSSTQWLSSSHSAFCALEPLAPARYSSLPTPTTHCRRGRLALFGR